MPWAMTSTMAIMEAKGLKLCPTEVRKMAGERDLGQLADQHAEEAERLLKSRAGWINSIFKAQVHATLAVYYSDKARPSIVGPGKET